MAEVIGVKFKDGGKVYYFDPCGLAATADQAIIVETARGIECGIVATENHEVPDEQIVHPLKKLVRIANAKDIAQMEENHRREQNAFEVCQRKIIEHKMEMKLVDVEYTFDNSKILFYFTADGRVDFRDLVKDLAGIFRTRIELRQIGVRDEAKMLGGLGICGRVFCCTSFLADFQPVSIKMAKEQGLSLNPTKISGTCGRLMCCLKYEQNAYDDLIRTTPRVGTPVSTPEGNGVICEITNLITGSLKVKIESGEGYSFKIFPKHEVTPLIRGERPTPDEAKAEEQQPSQPKSDRVERRSAPPRQGSERPPRQKPPRQATEAGDGQPSNLQRVKRQPENPPCVEEASADVEPGEEQDDAPRSRPRRRRGGRGRSNGTKPQEGAAPSLNPQEE